MVPEALPSMSKAHRHLTAYRDGCQSRTTVPAEIRDRSAASVWIRFRLMLIPTDEGGFTEFATPDAVG